MSLTTSIKYDIFISYAQVDDQPTSGMERGWISTLVKDMTVLLDQRCGRIGACRIWWDQGSLPHHGNITPEIEQALRDTGILLVIYSQGYLRSDWCSAEREHFLAHTGGADPDGKRIFLVEKDHIDLARRPPSFGDMYSHRFWETREKSWRTLGIPSTKEDDAYFTAMDRLARELYEQMEQVRDFSVEAPHQGTAPAPSVAADRPGTGLTGDTDAVFLAQVTEDLDPQRDQVRDYLLQADIRVVPDRLYPLDGKAFGEALERDLAGCGLFAQLLGPLPGRKLEGLDIGYVALQHQTALAGDKSVLQWRPKELDPRTAADPEYQRLLDRETVMAVGLTEFKRAIVERLKQECRKRDARRLATEDSAASTDAFVFLSNTVTDREQAERIGKILSRQGYVFASTLTEGEPEELKKDLEANLKECDGLIVVHGNSKPAEMRRLLRNCRTWMSRRERPIRALALYHGPPPDTKGNLGMGLGKMHTIDCCDGLDEAKIIDFLQALNSAGQG